MQRRLILLLPLGFSFLSGVTKADDWPNVRGPSWDGRSAEVGMANEWMSGEPPVIWARKMGQGYSGFAVVSGRAFTMQQTALGQTVVCWDSQTGETVWEHGCGFPYEPMGIYPGPRATPTVSGGRVFFVTPLMLVGCLDADDGNIVWEVDLAERFGGEGTGFGYSASLLVHDGKVILPVGGAGSGLVALDEEDGATVWAIGDQSASYCPTIPITLEGRTLLVSYLENSLTINDPATGRQLADHEVSHGYDEHAALPLWEEPRLIIAAPFKSGASCFRLSIVDAETPAERVELSYEWHSPQMSNDVCSSVLVDGHLYGFDLRDPQSKAHRPSRGWFRCLDIETGETNWTTDTVGQTSVIAVDGNLVLFVDTGEVILARSSPEAYEELGRMSLFTEEVCWTAPALAEGRLYLRTQSRAACLYLGDETGRPQAMDDAERSQILEAQRGWRIGWTIGGEREHPFMRPPMDDLWRWYLACLLGVFVPLSFVMTMAQKWKHRERTLSLVVHFCLHSIWLGMLMTAVLNRLSGDFWFVWPVSIWAAFQLAVTATFYLQASPADRVRRRWSRAAGLLYIVLSGFMFGALHQQSLPHEWVFLIGPLPALPLAIYAARSAVSRGWTPTTVLIMLLTMTVCFWSGPILGRLRDMLG